MPQRLLFSDMISDGQPVDRLLFLIYPPESVATHIAQFTQDQRKDRGLRGKPLEVEHLHITL
jgi:2'-5' RNA ligase